MLYESADYQELLNLVTPLVSYLDTRLRKAISADERLAVILRYLATGMSTQYRMLPLDWSAGARRHDHHPVLTKLHWLPVYKRVMFKTCGVGVEVS